MLFVAGQAVPHTANKKLEACGVALRAGEAKSTESTQPVMITYKIFPRALRVPLFGCYHGAELIQTEPTS